MFKQHKSTQMFLSKFKFKFHLLLCVVANRSSSFFLVYDAPLDSYVLHSQCRCGAQKLLNESPTPEEPTNLCQTNNVIDAAPRLQLLRCRAAMMMNRRV